MAEGAFLSFAGPVIFVGPQGGDAVSGVLREAFRTPGPHRSVVLSEQDEPFAAHHLLVHGQATTVVAITHDFGPDGSLFTPAGRLISEDLGDEVGRRSGFESDWAVSGLVLPGHVVPDDPEAVRALIRARVADAHADGAIAPRDVREWFDREDTLRLAGSRTSPYEPLPGGFSFRVPEPERDYWSDDTVDGEPLITPLSDRPFFLSAPETGAGSAARVVTELPAAFSAVGPPPHGASAGHRGAGDQARRGARVSAGQVVTAAAVVGVGAALTAAWRARRRRRAEKRAARDQSMTTPGPPIPANKNPGRPQGPLRTNRRW